MKIEEKVCIKREKVQNLMQNIVEQEQLNDPYLLYFLNVAEHCFLNYPTSGLSNGNRRRRCRLFKVFLKWLHFQYNKVNPSKKSKMH